MRTLFLSTWILCASAGAAFAQFDTTPLFAHGAWAVEHTHDSGDGSTWCAANTRNDAGQTFDITAYDDGNAILFVFDSRWSLAPRAVRFRIDIDYQTWTIDGSADRTSVSVLMNGEEEAGDFLDQLANGRAVAVYNEAGTRLALFSLRGSSAALEALGQCWARILPSRDPFGTSGGGSDPFTAASDPF